jgi:uncharacterized protein (TIGR02594 family)
MLSVADRLREIAAEIDRPIDADPPWLVRARRDLGVREVPGRSTHPRIAAYYRAAGLTPGDHAEIVPDDSTTPWCACAMSAWTTEEGLSLPNRPAAARSWATWGKTCEPRVGSVAVYSRGDNAALGHVALWLGRSGTEDIVLGGNQGNSVCIASRPMHTAIAYRWPVVG